MKYETLSNEELLKIILRENSNDKAASELINKFGDLKEIFIRTTTEELNEIKGLGAKKITQLHAIREISRRIYELPVSSSYRITEPNDVFKLVGPSLMYEEQEHFLVILLNTKNYVKSIENISLGTINSALVGPREVFRMAIKKAAASVLFVHNHPGMQLCRESENDVQPSASSEDLALTARLCESGKLLSIPVIDHVIICGHRFYSFKEKNLI